MVAIARRFKLEGLWLGTLVFATVLYASSSVLQAQSVNCYYHPYFNWCFNSVAYDCLCDE